MKHTVLGLGDTNYSQFCYVPQEIHKRMGELGSTCFYPPGWADDGTGCVLVYFYLFPMCCCNPVFADSLC